MRAEPFLLLLLPNRGRDHLTCCWGTGAVITIVVLLFAAGGVSLKRVGADRVRERGVSRAHMLSRKKGTQQGEKNTERKERRGTREHDHRANGIHGSVARLTGSPPYPSVPPGSPLLRLIGGAGGRAAATAAAPVGGGGATLHQASVQRREQHTTNEEVARGKPRMSAR